MSKRIVVLVHQVHHLIDALAKSASKIAGVTVGDGWDSVRGAVMLIGNQEQGK